MKIKNKRMRGAFMAEFTFAVVPLLLAWTCTWQLSRYFIARLVFKHAAVVGARAAAVFSNKNENNPGPGASKNDKLKDDLEDAVKAALGPWNSSINLTDLVVTDKSSKENPFDLVSVRINANYTCYVPLASAIVCAGGRTMTAVAEFPHQGANYTATEAAQNDNP